MNQHDMTELVLTASDARDFPDYRQVLARVLLELDARMTTLEVVVNASAKNTGEGRAEEARSGSVTGPSKQPVQARPTGVREDVSVVDEGPVASRQAAPSPASPSPDAVEALARELQRAHHDGAWSDVPLWTASETSQRGYLAEARYVLSRYEPRGASVCEWCGHPWIEHSDEIGCRHPDGDGYCECLQFEPTPSPRGSTASDKLCAYCALPSHESDACPDRPEAQPLPGGEGVLKTHAIGKIGLNNCVEVADGDALVARFYGDTAQLEALHRLLAPVLDAAGFSPAHETAKKAIERLLAQWRSGLEPRVPPSPASFSLNPGASKTPGSQQASEELDELLRMHARHDNDDTEDCWTKPAVRAIQYLSDLRWDLQVTTNRAAILAETNESLRRMIADMAAYAGTTFGADEPVKNAEVVKKALAPSPASGEWARMTTREREEILKNDEIALAIADGMARCADVFCDQAQLDRRREAARMTHKRLADSRELLADLRAEAVAAWAAAEAAEERCSYKACGCMYDRKDDVCSVHSPIVSKVTAERDAARSELAALLAKSARRYAHMCRSEHVEIGFNDCVPDQPDELNCKECGGDSTRAPQPEREAQGEPTLERCLTVFGLAYNEAKVGASPMATDTEAWCERQGIAAVRTLCLSRAPSPSPALAAIVEAGDAMRADASMVVLCSLPDKRVDGLRERLYAWDRARAALPKGGGA